MTDNEIVKDIEGNIYISNEELSRGFAIGRCPPPNTLSIGVGEHSAILTIGLYQYDLRAINFNEFEAIEIDGIRFVKEKMEEYKSETDR